MKAKLFNIDGKASGEINLPPVFATPYRPDVIRRAVLAEQSSRRQPYGTDVLAGKRSSAHYHGMRHYVFTMMNREMARLPRIHGKSAGYLTHRVRIVPQSVKGRRAHPPMKEKLWLRKVNKKEFLLAIKSALAASTNAELLQKRGHVFKESPVVVRDDFESIDKTKAAVQALQKIGLGTELERCLKKKVRAGVGKRRGRKYRRKKGPAVILSKECNALRAFSKIPGIDVRVVGRMDAEALAPGCQAGRLLIISESALKELEKW